MVVASRGADVPPRMSARMGSLFAKRQTRLVGPLTFPTGFLLALV